MRYRIDLNVYRYSKEKHKYDRNGELFLSSKNQYLIKTKQLLSDMGLIPVTKKRIFTIGKPVTDQYGFVITPAKKRTVYLPTDVYTWCRSDYIYLKIIDPKKLSWNTVIRSLCIKKNTKAMFLDYYAVKKGKTPTKFSRILAVPIEDIDDIYGFAHEMNNKFNKNLGFLKSIQYPFGGCVNIRDVFTNELLELEDVFNYVKEAKRVDLVKKLAHIHDPNDTIIHRVGGESSWIEPEKIVIKPNDMWFIGTEYEKRITDRDHEVMFLNQIYSYGYSYRKDLIVDKPQDLKDKLLKFFPVFIRERTEHYTSTYPNIGREALFDMIEKDGLVFVKHFLLKIPFKPGYNYVITQACFWCFNHQKRYLNLKPIALKSNQHRLNNADRLLAAMLINHVFEETNPYVKESSKKQYKRFLLEYILEVIGKLHYEYESGTAKTFDRDKYKAYEHLLNKHISGVFFSDKEFNLLVDKLKDEDKTFTLRPRVILKYTILKSMGFKIGSSYSPKKCGKIISFTKTGSITCSLYKLFSLCNKENYFKILYICLKKYLDENEQIDETTASDIRELIKSLDDPPDS